jgi:hypothetical protein
VTGAERPALRVVSGAEDPVIREWGGWGSNPRPADYEKYAPSQRTR